VESIKTYEAIHSDPQSHNFLTTMAPRHSFSILLVAILLVGETIVAVVVISQNYTTILRNCSTSDNYTIASSCKINLVKLMANLEPDSVDDHGFRMSSAGEPPDAIFGLTMCYADRNWDQCQKCLRAGIASMPETCPSSWKMMVSYRACALRYTNESFFSVADVSRTTVESYAPIDPNATDMVGMNTTRTVEADCPAHQKGCRQLASTASQ
jgi:hypothetical protein